MELLQLHYFRTVARLEHMTKAAEKLRVAQPALSKTIARLEQSLGVSLFDRQGRQIRLNTFGRAFLAKAETALNALEEGRSELMDMAGLDHGSVQLASPILHRLSGAIGAFREERPEVNFLLTNTSNEEMVRLLEEGKIDYGFTSLPIGKQRISELPILKEEVYLAVPPGHKLANRSSVTMSEAAGESFIGYKKDHIFRARDDALFQKAGITPNIVCEVNDPSVKASLIRAGIGISFVGACNKSAEAPLDPLVLLQIESPACLGTFQLVWQNQHYLSKAALAFREFVIRYYAED
ncbi:LysR family transcriptional regulator [Cohnella zeiphila]|uniref:LysR family transcriptional regulator n=1 Tax=Cohnella zeiphila TaxID=2761120 RepID=A0A7X0SK55_9BACL|nr:LysR family transcriptional regulator [Cohnella zeiphila]MBB6731351.1 LysR family transcriptional regulator [Cohnella zeiphila]